MNKQAKIHILYHPHNHRPLRRLMRASRNLSVRISFMKYPEFFARAKIESGTWILLDHEYLNAAEMDLLGFAFKKFLELSPHSKVLNPPWDFMQRVELLSHLNALGVNPVEVTPLDGCKIPSRFPVFIRPSEGAITAEPPILSNASMYQSYLDQLKSDGFSKTGWIAISLEAEPFPNGQYRKYGAIVVGRHVIPQHIIEGPSWMVKRAGKGSDTALAEEEERYVVENPHEGELRNIAEISGTGFGRIDYGFAGGNLVVFEINSNPTLPNLKGGNPARLKMRQMIYKRIEAALQDIALPRGVGPTISFSDPVRYSARFISKPRNPFAIRYEFQMHKLRMHFSKLKRQRRSQK